MTKYRLIKKIERPDGGIINVEEIIDSETIPYTSLGSCDVTHSFVRELNVTRIDSDSIKSPKEYALTLSPYEISLMQTALLSYTREMRGQPNLITDCGPYPALENLLRKLGDLV